MAKQLKTYAIRISAQDNERSTVVYVQADTVAVDAGYETVEFERNGEKVGVFKEDHIVAWWVPADEPTL